MSKIAAMLASNASPKCCVCAKSVYKTEEVKALGKVYHKTCFCCSIPDNNGCGKVLTIMGGYQVRDGRIPYCKSCYAKLYGNKGMNSAVADTTTYTQTVKATSYAPTIAPTATPQGTTSPQKPVVPVRRESGALKAMAEIEAAQSHYKKNSSGFAGKSTIEEKEGRKASTAAKTTDTKTTTESGAPSSPSVFSNSVLKQVNEQKALAPTSSSTTSCNFVHPDRAVSEMSTAHTVEEVLAQRSSVAALAKGFSDAGDVATAASTATTTTTNSKKPPFSDISKRISGAMDMAVAASAATTGTQTKLATKPVTRTQPVHTMQPATGAAEGSVILPVENAASGPISSATNNAKSIKVGGKLDHAVHQEQKFQGDGDEVAEDEWD